MRVKEAVLAKKSILDAGRWAYGGKVPRSAFFLAKSKQYHFGTTYRWRVLRCEANGSFYRILIAYSLPKAQYYARLAIETGNDLQHITSYEFHGTHGGWHVHSACGQVEHVPVGRPKGPWLDRIPDAWQERRIIYGVTDDNALKVACRAFRISGVADENGQATQGQMSLL